MVLFPSVPCLEATAEAVAAGQYTGVTATPGSHVDFKLCLTGALHITSMLNCNARAHLHR